MKKRRRRKKRRKKKNEYRTDGVWEKIKKSKKNPKKNHTLIKTTNQPFNRVKKLNN